MKLKKVIFTHTGEVKVPKVNEYFYHKEQFTYIKATNYEIYPYEIVTREEILEDWKPKECQTIFFIGMSANELMVMASNHIEGSWTENCIKQSNCFPTRELAEAKLSEIKTLLK